MRWKHDSDTNFKSKLVSTPRWTENEEMPNNTSTVVLDELDVVDTKKQEVTKPDNRKGSSHRKSYTVEFKAKTLERLEFFSHLKVKKKWEKVAEEQGISKSLVVKWNTNRKKIKAETECNKRKGNSGTVKATRYRRN